jgi:hypothetical protein
VRSYQGRSPDHQLNGSNRRFVDDHEIPAGSAVAIT